MDWIKFSQYLLDNNLITNYSRPLQFVRNLPKTVVTVKLIDEYHFPYI